MKGLRVYLSKETPYDTKASAKAWRTPGEEGKYKDGLVISFNTEGVKSTVDNEDDLHHVDVALSLKALRKMGLVPVDADALDLAWRKGYAVGLIDGAIERLDRARSENE